MTTYAAVHEALMALRQEGAALLPVSGIGLLRVDGANGLILDYLDDFGFSGSRMSASRAAPAAWPPRAGVQRIDGDALAAAADEPLEARLLLTGLPDPLRQAYAARQAVIHLLPDSEPPVALVLALKESGPWGRDQDAHVTHLARLSMDTLHQAEPAARALVRLQRLEELHAGLPALLRVLDVREVFARVSELTKDVLAHDLLTLGLFDGGKVTVYAHTSPEGMPQAVRGEYPRALLDPWLYNILDDLAGHPVERHDLLTQRGGRSSLRLAIRLDDRLYGGLNFTSNEPDAYDSTDLAIGRHIAEYVALALSHHRQAEEARRTEELRARASASELLDELLATITDAGELQDVFERVSVVARKVLAHDALALAVVLPDGRHSRVYGSSGATFPEIVQIPESVLDRVDMEIDLVDDLQADPACRDLPSTKMGYRATLRAAIRLDGRIAGALSFISFTPSLYSMADAPVARRIADRLALAVSRDRRLQADRRADEASSRALALEERVRTLTDELNARSGYHRVIGTSASWKQVLKQAAQVAPTETTVLLLGESGTGKEVIARFVHGASRRAGGPFVALNCAALPENLLEAELFGYERGAFTGAMQSKPGQLEQAAGGTLFLDEVAEMSPSAQAKFLRVLQEREFQRLGGTRVLKTDARVVAATNRDLTKAMERGVFREDLYYRLNVFSIRLPPLRERPEDVLPLAEQFVADISRTLGRPPGGVSREARAALLHYRWPGNVRELRNVLERASILADGSLIAAEHLAVPVPSTLTATAPEPEDLPEEAADEADDGGATPPTARGDLKSVERDMIERALKQARFNKSEAAKQLGLTRAQLYVRLKRHGLE
jgi:transcriptional regulator with GAF, ATPase, and Fis domain